MAAPGSFPTPEKFWERIADKSVALLVALAILFMGFYYHKQAMDRVYSLLIERVGQRLERIERCACQNERK